MIEIEHEDDEIIVVLTKEECHCSLSDFYKLIAEKIGIIENPNTMYDCTKIHITENVQDEIMDCYREHSLPDEDIAERLLVYGPKADFNYKTSEYAVKVEEGYVCES